MIDAGEFDYVVAGGGTAGCVVAARLTEDPGVTVCLIEAGPFESVSNVVPIPSGIRFLAREGSTLSLREIRW